MKLRRLLCFLLALSLFICGAYLALPCGYVAAAEVSSDRIIINGVPLPPFPAAWDREAYPYAFIEPTTWDNIEEDWFEFVVCTGPLQPTRPTNKYFIFESSEYGYMFWKCTDGTSWEFVEGSPDYAATAMQSVWWTNHDLYNYDGSLYLSASEPIYVSPSPSCPNTDANCDNICDDCGELLPMEYWSTDLEYMTTSGYNIVDQTAADYFCILYNKKDRVPDLFVGETKFVINTSGDVLLTNNPKLYKLNVWEDGSFSHYLCDEVSHTSDGVYLDPNQYVLNNSIRVLYSNHNIDNRFVYNPDYDPFGGGTTVGGGEGREQVDRFDIDINTYDPIGGLPADPEYGSGRVDVVVSPSAPPVSVPISPTSPVATPTPSVPVVTPSPDPSEPNSVIIQNQITNIGENIAALPEKLGDKLANAIKGLFVPSENDFIAIRVKWNLLLEERFGAVYESTAIIDSIVDTFQYSGDMSSIKFPSVTVDLAGTPFTFGGWDVEVIPEGFKFLVSSVKLIVSIVCTVLFVNAMRKKLEGLINR